MLIGKHHQWPVCSAEGARVAGGAGPANGQAMADIDAALTSLANDLGADTVLEIVDLYLGEAPRQVADVRKAAEAGEAVVMRRVAHTLKSTSATVGASALSAVCLKIEHLARDQRLNEAREYIDQLTAEEAIASDIVRTLREKLATQAAAV